MPAESIMSGSDDENPFVEVHDVLWHIDEELLTWFFETQEFKQWQRKGRSWQLRIIGSPGSGKTTLTALAVRRLREIFHAQNVRIASVFLREKVSSMEGDDLSSAFLRSLLNQLSGVGDASLAAREDGTQYSDLDRLRETIYQRIEQLDRAFLLVDDFDLCNQVATVTIETELSKLQLHGLSIMVTSRLPHRHHTLKACCDVDVDVDVDPEHPSLECLLYWCCRECDGETMEFLICQSCIDNGYICRKCGQISQLYEPYLHVDFYLKNFGQGVFSSFVARELERVHGDIGLDSGVTDKPPLSALGRALKSSQYPTAAAEEMRTKILDMATVNVTMIKSRLDACQGARSLEEARRLADRLPDSILAIFDAAIERVKRQPKAQRDLGLRAIVGAADREKFSAQPFKRLETWLHREAVIESKAASIPHYQLAEVLHAAQGLICADNGEQAHVEAYHPNFARYVMDNYNETLFWNRSDMQISSVARSSTSSLVSSKGKIKGTFENPVGMRRSSTFFHGSRTDLGSRKERPPLIRRLKS